MALSTLLRYDKTQVTQTDGHAIVIGAGMAGLCAARVLADAFTKVTVIDQDPLPSTPTGRRGVPQDSQPHVIQEAGRATLEDFFPGFCEKLLRAGGLLIDGASDLDYYYDGDFLADGPERLPNYCATRPLFEHTVRECATNIEGITLRPECRFIDYLYEDTTICGVTVDDSTGRTTNITADLVVDASGRMSPTPKWLENHGYIHPEVSEIQVDVTYSTVIIERPPTDRRMLVVPPTPPRTRGGGAFPIEGDRWIVTIQVMYDDTAPQNCEELLEYAESLPVPDLKQLLETQSWRSDEVTCYPFPSNIRRHYENLTQFPDGLVVIGDALVSFNPLYGQGVSVAALEALSLHHALASGKDDTLAPRFYNRAEEVLDNAWTMAIGADLQFYQANQSQPRGTGIFNWYLTKLRQSAHTDGTLTDAFSRVARMEKPPLSLLQPSIVRRVLFPKD